MTITNVLIRSSIAISSMVIVLHSSMVTATRKVIEDAVKQQCALRAYRKSAPCICRFPYKWQTWKCKKYFERKVSKRYRIVNETKVPKDTYRWFTRVTQNGEWGGCTGSLVTPEYVLTAAHCSFGEEKKVNKCQIGALCPDKSNNCGQEMVTVDIDTIYNHPKYNEKMMINDFALVKLKRRVTNIIPVKMDMGNVVPNYDEYHKGLYSIGFFGRNHNSNGTHSMTLQHIELEHIPIGKCIEYYSRNSIRKSMLCASSPSQDMCQGNSGGPLYDVNIGISTLVGVMSWGYGCANPDYPAVFAKISDQVRAMMEYGYTIYYNFILFLIHA